MPKPTSKRSFVSEDNRIRYVHGTICLTLWLDLDKNILAFEIIFGLAVDEWAFLYHRNGNSKYCKVDDGEARVGRHEKQVMSGKFPLPAHRIDEFNSFDDDISEKEKSFVLNVMRNSCDK